MRVSIKGMLNFGCEEVVGEEAVCPIKCLDSKCSAAVKVCQKYPHCCCVSLNTEKTWGTLKMRRSTQIEPTPLPTPPPPTPPTPSPPPTSLAMKWVGERLRSQCRDPTHKAGLPRLRAAG